jgi:hypothetical protein
MAPDVANRSEQRSILFALRAQEFDHCREDVKRHLQGRRFLQAS